MKIERIPPYLSCLVYLKLVYFKVLKVKLQLLYHPFISQLALHKDNAGSETRSENSLLTFHVI